MEMSTGMTLAEWIIMVILALALMGFLIVGIILAVKAMGLIKEAQKIVKTGQDIAVKADNIADKTDDVVDNIKGFTSAGKLVKTLVDRVSDKVEAEPAPKKKTVKKEEKK